MPSVQAVRSSDVLLTLGPVAGRGSPQALGGEAAGFSGLISGYLDAATHSAPAALPVGDNLPADGEVLPQAGEDYALAESAGSDQDAELSEPDIDLLSAIAFDAEKSASVSDSGSDIKNAEKSLTDSEAISNAERPADLLHSTDELAQPALDPAALTSGPVDSALNPGEAELASAENASAENVVATELDSAAADRLSQESLTVRTDPQFDPSGAARAASRSGEGAERVAEFAEGGRSRRADAASQVDRLQSASAGGDDALVDKLDPRKPDALVRGVERQGADWERLALVEALRGRAGDAAGREASSLPGTLPQAAALQSASLQTTPLHSALQSLAGGGVRPNGEAAVAFGMPRGLGSEAWSQGVSNRMVWMVGQKVQVAELRLDPPELGSLQVRLTLNQDQASVSFISPHAHVRDALEQQMPRLREMLQEGGVDLGQADVSDQSPRNEGGESESDGRSSAGDSRWASTTASEGEDETVAAKSVSLVDYYA